MTHNLDRANRKRTLECMREQSPIIGVAGASRRNCPVQCDAKPAARPSHSTRRISSVNSLFRNILRLSYLDAILCGIGHACAINKLLVFNILARAAKIKCVRRSAKDYLPNPLFWKILLASYLFAIFCREEDDQTRANPFRKNTLRDLSEKNVLAAPILGIRNACR